MTFVKEAKEISGAVDDIEWSPEDEIQLFYALDGLIPVGINKHFNMLCIVDRLSKSLNKDVSSSAVWAHLETMYDMEALNDLESLPFTNEIRPFKPPESEFGTLLFRKKCDILEQQQQQQAKKMDKTDFYKSAGKVQQIQTPAATATVAKQKEVTDKKVAAKIVSAEVQKRTPKRTRGSMSLESAICESSPSTTPPPVFGHKRRRI